MCDCHDSEQEHERAYFGNAVRIQGEIDRLLRADGIDPEDQNEIQWRLKR